MPNEYYMQKCIYLVPTSIRQPEAVCNIIHGRLAFLTECIRDGCCAAGRMYMRYLKKKKTVPTLYVYIRRMYFADTRIICDEMYTTNRGHGARPLSRMRAGERMIYLVFNLLFNNAITRRLITRLTNV